MWTTRYDEADIGTNKWRYDRNISRGALYSKLGNKLPKMHFVKHNNSPVGTQGKTVQHQ